MTDRQRLLDYLIEHGEVTSYEIRVLALSGNPSQRVAELREEGHHITAERFTRDGRPCTHYTLRPVKKSGRVEDGQVPRAAGESPRGGSSRQGTASPCRSAAATSGEVNDQGGGDPSSHPAAFPTLFEVEEPRRGHYESEAA